MGQSLLQAPQSTQVSFRSGKITANLLKIDRQAPRGQRTLQKNLLCPIARIRIVKSMASRIPRWAMLVVPFMTAQGTADSMVPTGHRRQKYSDDSGVR